MAWKYFRWGKEITVTDRGSTDKAENNRQGRWRPEGCQCQSASACHMPAVGAAEKSSEIQQWFSELLVASRPNGIVHACQDFGIKPRGIFSVASHAACICWSSKYCSLWAVTRMYWWILVNGSINLFLLLVYERCSLRTMDERHCYRRLFQKMLSGTEVPLWLGYSLVWLYESSARNIQSN